jgi:methylated-DNA-protein-cysteine methyltransferase-like protein
MPKKRLHPLRPGLLAHASGALWIEDARAMVVGDVRLRDAAVKVFKTVDELGARTVILAGDIVQTPKPGSAERASIERTLKNLVSRSSVVIARSKHDRRFAQDFASLGLEVVDEWRSGDLIVMHGDRTPARLPKAGTLVLGHVHPAGVIDDAAGLRHRVPMFLVADRLILLPAFSPYSRDLDIRRGLPPAVERLATGRTVAPIVPVQETPDAAIQRTIREIPRGKVATYGQVAEAAGYPGYHRQVCQVLNRSGDSLPWHRVLGAGGEIKIPGEGGHDQRVRLSFEGVRFRGKRVDMAAHGHLFTNPK